MAYAKKNLKKEKSLASPVQDELLLDAISFACREHDGQMRKDKSTPYVAHPIRVMTIMSKIFGVADHKMLIACVLHDTFEDCDTSLNEIKEKFGLEIAEYVEILSKDENLSRSLQEEAYLDQLSKAPLEVKICKLADIYDNLTDNRAFSKVKLRLLQKKYRRIFNQIKLELPKEWNHIENIMENKFAELNPVTNIAPPKHLLNFSSINEMTVSSFSGDRFEIEDVIINVKNLEIEYYVVRKNSFFSSELRLLPTNYLTVGEDSKYGKLFTNISTEDFDDLPIFKGLTQSSSVPFDQSIFMGWIPWFDGSEDDLKSSQMDNLLSNYIDQKQWQDHEKKTFGLDENHYLCSTLIGSSAVRRKRDYHGYIEDLVLNIADSKIESFNIKFSINDKDHQDVKADAFKKLEDENEIIHFAS